MNKFLTLLFLSLFSIPLTNFASELPDLGHPSEQILTPDEEAQMGLEFFKAIRAQVSLVSDPLINDYIQSLGQKLASNSPDQARTFNFFIINANEINAFAGPGGHIGINSGLFLAAKNESQLASVMAHEIAHVTQKHLTRAFQASEGASATAIASILAGILVSASDPTAGAAIMFGGAASGMQQQINFTRSNEYEADRVGISILDNSNLNPKGMIEFFETMQRNSFYGTENDIEYLRTHPLNTARISEASSRAFSKNQNKPDNSLDFDLAHARLLVASHNNPGELIKEYTKSTRNDQVNEYALALVYNRLQNYIQAIQILNKLVKKQPHLWYKIELAENYRKNNQRNESLNILKSLYEIYPTFKPVLFSYVNLLLEHQQTDIAIKVLKRQLYYAKNAESLELLANAYAANNNTFLAYTTRAEQYSLEGDLHLSAQQLKNALELPGIDEFTKNKLQAKIQRLKNNYNIVE